MLLPVTASQVQRVDCIRIKADVEWHLVTSVPGETIGSWQDADAAAIIDLVANLPDGEVMRCFFPGYGIRAHGADGILFEIAFCFRCHNVLTLSPGPQERRGLGGFDPDSQPAQELLAKFRACDQPETALSGDQA
ncbi:hypothetical protein [Actinocrispum wychmicini]|uniref:Uncharacterized protein n=1 Tax=Actinocrispum wychmicini TaxID=1213861 RepID=A0A4R2JFK2_9PSEU|nr:hypothetical protein [Actinocrispum wychmicini]TCO55686.1 hypothetical protein EV192_107108 [Actinocrispum wychmicini]